MSKCKINKSIFQYIGKNKLQVFFLKLLPKLAKLHPSNKIEDRQNYPQTWWLMPRRWIKVEGQFYKNGYNKLKRASLRCIIEKFCEVLTGHELSKTEWGYGGGRFLDRNCRWCDKSFKVPKNEEPTKKDELEDIASVFGKPQDGEANE